MFLKLDSELTALLKVSLGFTICIAIEDTFKNMQKIVVSSITDDNPEFHVEGYTLTGIIYSVFCISLWFVPYISHLAGARLILILSSFGFLYFYSSYALEMEWALYSGVFALGIAKATFSLPQSQYLIDCSKPENVSRNVGIFFASQRMLQILGNIFVYFNFEGKKYLDRSTRRLAVYGFMGANVLSSIAFTLLPKTTKGSSGQTPSFATTIKKCWSMLILPDMLCMILFFIYSGFQQSFTEGIYGPSVGFTLALGDSVKGLVALSGISKSIGSSFGFVSPIPLSRCIKNQSYLRRVMILSGVTGQLGTYLITFLFLPNNANFGNTYEESYIHPSLVVLLGSFLQGFGDSCLEFQFYSFLGDYYRNATGEGTVLYRCIRNIFIATSFYWSSHFGLHTQVGILSVTAVVGVIGSLFAEHISESARLKQTSDKSLETCSKT